MNLLTEKNNIPFERFWRWLIEHPNCIVEAGSTTIALFDFEDFHWTLSQDEGRAVVQMVRGKNLVAEMVLEPSELLFVQISIDSEGADRGHWIFEVMAGTREEPFVAAYFVLNHGFDDRSHEVLKH